MRYRDQVSVPVENIRDDFDRIAALPDDRWDHNAHYHPYLLRHLPARCAMALDLGCGTGAFARALARRADQVLGLDLSPQMIAVARERAGDQNNIEFRVADALQWEWPEGQFDCIASIATLHHLPLATLLTTLRRALAQNGTLVVLDLYQGHGLGDSVTSALALPLSSAARVALTGHLRRSSEARAIWAEHACHDTYPSLDHIRRVCVDIMPGARVRKHLFWRYSIVWHKQRTRSLPFPSSRVPHPSTAPPARAEPIMVDNPLPFSRHSRLR